jgi:Mg2+ and Co2+ transporter CorA
MEYEGSSSCSQELRNFEVLCNTSKYAGLHEENQNSRPNTKLENNPLKAARDCLLNTFHVRPLSSNLKMRNGMLKDYINTEPPEIALRYADRVHLYRA